MAELEWNTWDEVCALDFQNASGAFPPVPAVVGPAVKFRDNFTSKEDGEKAVRDLCITRLSLHAHRHFGLPGNEYVDGDMYSARLCLLEPSGVEDVMERRKEYVDIRGLNHRHTVRWDPGVVDSRVLTVWYDCLCLISLFRTVMSLSYDWDEVFVWTGHDEVIWPFLWLGTTVFAMIVFAISCG